MIMSVIKIIKCSDSLFWYADKVGQILELRRPSEFSNHEYICTDDSGYANIVKKCDAILWN